MRGLREAAGADLTVPTPVLRRRRWACLAASLALTTCFQSAWAKPRRWEVPELSCSRTLALGLAGYEKYYERRLGGLARPDEDYIWGTYAECRHHRNQQLIAHLPRPSRSWLTELQSSLGTLEEGYLACAYTEAYSASIGGYLKSWSAPVREDFYARILPHLRQNSPRQVQLTPQLLAAISRVERKAVTWERVVDKVNDNKESDASYNAHRARDLSKQLPILRRALRQLVSLAKHLPEPAQERLAGHLSVYLNRVDNWMRG